MFQLTNYLMNFFPLRKERLTESKRLGRLRGVGSDAQSTVLMTASSILCKSSGSSDPGFVDYICSLHQHTHLDGATSSAS